MALPMLMICAGVDDGASVALDRHNPGPQGAIEQERCTVEGLPGAGGRVTSTARRLVYGKI